MTRTHVLCSLVALLAIPATTLAQVSGAASPAPVEKAAPAPAALTDQELRPPQGYTYSADGRRDPFVTLLKRGSEATGTTAAGRAAGLAGLNTGEVTLRGILVSQGEYVAMLLGSDSRTYIVRPGDTLADGIIRAITADAMVVLQQVHDPLSPQLKQREVQKRLRQTEGTH
jgi:Tfp pilus assembly protein PilP